jgi:hypothetical protein
MVSATPLLAVASCSYTEAVLLLVIALIPSPSNAPTSTATVFTIVPQRAHCVIVCLTSHGENAVFFTFLIKINYITNFQQKQ